MNRLIGLIVSFSTLILMTGCWDRSELPEKGFVMGVAIDETDDGRISLTTQVYRPSQGVSAIGAKAAETAYVNVTTQNSTVSRAIRDIPINLGRKAQWSHIRLIIIGEKLAREQKIYDILEFFYRDHEPRLTISLMVAKGNAAQYLSLKPLIENTTSQQLFQSGKSAASSSEKTIYTNLLKLGLQMKSQVGNALIPYVFFTEDPSKITNVAGAGLIKKGKLVGRMDPEKLEYMQMVTDEFESAMLDIPCPESASKVEVVEVLKFDSKLQPAVITEDSLKVRLKIKMEIAVSELSCFKIKTIDDQLKFSKNVEKSIIQHIEETTDWLKQQKFDAIGLGNKVYMKKPHLWKKLQPDWDNHFARTQFDIKVKVKINNSGTVIPKPAIMK